jgi:CHAT domain-containing protein
MMGLLACALLGACHKAPDPSALFQSISSDYLHGDLELARQRATRAREDLSAGDPQSGTPWPLQFRLLEAEILLRQTKWKDALALLAGRGSPAPREGELAIKYNLLCGLAHAHLGDLPKGNQELREAHRMAEDRHSPQIAEVLRTEGLIARDAGRMDEADEEFHSSLVAARRSGDAFLQAIDLVDLGEDGLENGHFDQALVFLQASAEIAQSVQARRQLQLATGNMGWAYYNLGDFERALLQFQQAEQLAQQIGMTRNRTMWLQDAGLADYKLGDLDAARRYEAQALQSLSALADDGGGVEQVTNIETNLALLLYEQGQYPAAQDHIDKAAMQARNSKDQHVVAYVGFVQGLLAERGGGADPEKILLATRRIATDQDVQTDIEVALGNLYAARGLSEKARLWYRQAIETFEAKRSAESDEALRLAAFGFGAGVYREYADFLVNSGRPDEALLVLDSSRARTLDEGLGSSGNGHTLDQDGIDPRAVARNANATIMFYSLGPQQSYLWAITGRESRLFMLPAAKDIQAQVEAYQKAILKSDDPIRAATPAATLLYAMLVKPAAALIPAGSRVFLIPDGVLHTLNFETLVESTQAGARYWIDDVTLTSASSIRMLAHLKGPAATQATRELLLIGDPTAAASGFDALPNAATEIQRIREHFKPGTQTVLTQGQAVPSAYAQSGPDQYRYIHFVAHGTASRLSPLDSAVVLSPPPGRPDDFKLYAHDILQHPLHAQLVTISTCYGSGVRAYAGEGLVGLAWVFLRAGSHNVIGALWQADDTSTPLLMDRLYAELQAGRAPDVALRNAKLSLIHSSSVYRKPFYWAPFQLYSGS